MDSRFGFSPKKITRQILWTRFLLLQKTFSACCASKRYLSQLSNRPSIGQNASDFKFRLPMAWKQDVTVPANRGKIRGDLVR